MREGDEGGEGTNQESGVSIAASGANATECEYLHQLFSLFRPFRDNCFDAAHHKQL